MLEKGPYDTCIAPDKRGYPHNIFPISPQKCLLDEMLLMSTHNIYFQGRIRSILVPIERLKKKSLIWSLAYMGRGEGGGWGAKLTIYAVQSIRVSVALLQTQQILWNILTEMAIIRLCVDVQAKLGLCCSHTVTVLKFRTLYFILFWPKFWFLCSCFL